MAKKMPKYLEWSKEQFEKKKNDSIEMNIYEAMHSKSYEKKKIRQYEKIF